MKKLLLFLALFMAIPMFVGCGDDGNDGEEIEGTLRKSDLYGTWKQVNVTMTINQNGTYTYTRDGVNKPSLSGTWSFDGYARIWVNHRNDGNSYTNIIHLLNKTTFSYTDQYGNHDIWSRVSNDSQDKPEDKPEPEPEPEPEPTAFKGLKGIYELKEDGEEYLLAGNFQCDELGRLISYEYGSSKIRYEYEYYDNKIECRVSVFTDVYNLDNGLITSIKEDHHTSGTSYIHMEYYANKRVKRFYENLYTDDYKSYNYKWDNEGNIYELNRVLGRSSYLGIYEYTSYTTTIPPISFAWGYFDKDSEFQCAVYDNSSVDFFLLWQGYYGDSIPTHYPQTIELGSEKEESINNLYYTLNYYYEFDSRERPTKITMEWFDHRDLSEETRTIILKWE